MGKSTRTKTAIRASLAGGAMVAAFFAYSSVAAQSGRGGATYHATLSALNGGSARGEATIRQSGQTLRVHITATGLEANVHLGHIHGVSSGNRPVDSTCPTLAQDTDDDGFIELLEGVPSYGPVLVDFMNVDPDLDGTVDFTTTVQLSSADAVIPLNKRHVVIHGMSVPAVGAGTPGEVDGTAGFKVILPVLCGEIGNARNSNSGRSTLDFRSPPRN